MYYVYYVCSFYRCKEGHLLVYSMYVWLCIMIIMYVHSKPLNDWFNHGGKQNSNHAPYKKNYSVSCVFKLIVDLLCLRVFSFFNSSKKAAWCFLLFTFCVFQSNITNIALQSTSKQVTVVILIINFINLITNVVIKKKQGIVSNKENNKPSRWQEPNK